MLQFEAQEPFYLGMAAEGRLILEKEGNVVRYFKRRSAPGYVDKKIAAFDADTTGKFVCFNSLNYCTPDEQEKVLLYLERMTGLGGKPLERREIQMRLLDILRDVDAFCRERGIRYSMAYGTLLGAVRHKGFIPWDDDIDLNMPRADFERFLPLFRERFGDKYYIYVPGETKGYDYLLVHIMTRDVRARALTESTNLPTGICLDLFIIENAPDSALLRKLHGIWCMGMRYLVSCARFRRNREEMLTICRSSPELPAASPSPAQPVLPS